MIKLASITLVILIEMLICINLALLLKTTSRNKNGLFSTIRLESHEIDLRSFIAPKVAENFAF